MVYRNFYAYNYDHREYEYWRDEGMKPRQRPASVIPLGHAVPVEDRDNDSYRAYLFRHKGKVVLAIGCRRFTLAEAYAHWDGIASVNLMADDHDQRKRRRRALYIIKSVIPRAYNRARKLGWKV